VSNYWILQANPATYFIVHYYLDDYVKLHPDEEGLWNVERRFENEFTKGDIAFIWKCRGEPVRYEAEQYYEWKARRCWQGTERGICAVAEIVSSPQSRAMAKAEIEHKKQFYVGDMWKREQEPRLRIRYKYVANLVHNILTAEQIRENVELARVWEQFAKPGCGQGRSAFRLEPREGKVLWELIFGSRPKKSGKTARKKHAYRI
jgi:hypothetical protein